MAEPDIEAQDYTKSKASAPVELTVPNRNQTSGGFERESTSQTRDVQKEKPITTNEQATQDDDAVIDPEDPIHGTLESKKCFPLYILWCRNASTSFYIEHKKRIKLAALILALLLYTVYFIGALVYRFGDEGSIRILLVTSLVILGWVYHICKKKFGDDLYAAWTFLKAKIDVRWWRLFRTLFWISVCAMLLVFFIGDVVMYRPINLVSVIGVVVFVLVMFICSKSPAHVDWTPVIWGMMLQFIFALAVLRTTWGRIIFTWLGDRVQEYMAYVDSGCIFLFGESFEDHFFMFKAMPTIVFFGSTIAILYYLGWVQVVIEKIAWIMEQTMGIAAMEALHAAVNIFIGWGEATMLIQPLLDRMTLSEIHTVMTNGFSTVAGSTLAIYIWYGAPANHLLSASVMSAPAALALSKLFYPETTKTKITRNDAHNIPRLGRGLIDAITVGAAAAVPVITYIVITVIAFMSLLACINATLSFLGTRVGLEPPHYPVLTFQLICSYVFWPVVLLMGVPPSDCRSVARMVGIKTFVSEFYAYEDLGKVRKNRILFESYNGTWNWTTSGDIYLTSINKTLVNGIISPRAEVIATYALCGFSNILSAGIMIGAFSAVCPNRKQDFVNLAIRALITGAMACFMTACVAGVVQADV